MMRWVLKGVLGLVGLIVVATIAGSLYQVVGGYVDQRRFAPPGQLVDVSGRKMHLNCTGTGSPTVVLDAMGGGWSLHWSLVQPKIAEFTRVCSYDRAGYGWSDPGPEPRTVERIATELHELLGSAKVVGPFVLVGHSFSGYTVRVFRHRYSKEVAGIVMVDAAQEDIWTYPGRRKAREQYVRMLPIAKVVAATGVMRLSVALDNSPLIPNAELQKAPIEVQPLIRAGLTRASYLNTVVQEADATAQSQQETRATGSLDDLPLVVITANKQSWLASIPDGVDPAAYNDEWLDLQKKLVALSTHSMQAMAEKSTHYVQFDQPEIVVDGVRRIVDEVRAQRAQ